ncbi:MAG TPA: hypothetical protein VH020_07300 [Stellaceae bacterium]|jgi:hypothetical protein|nr:hypothetical protein [Stellaceae bacterium]
MTPLDLLKEQIENVKTALEETLDRDYGPETLAYYDECRSRIDELRWLIPDAAADPQILQTVLSQVSKLADWICLIERSHLGEFSWPFAAALKKIAENLLAEPVPDSDPLSPIIHIISEGEDYKIVFEEIALSATSTRKLVVIAFPRSLKYIVLFHTLFGHELGHTAIRTNGIGKDLQEKCLKIIADGVLHDQDSATQWLRRNDAPVQMKNVLSDFQTAKGVEYSLDSSFLSSWHTELVCDLIGLILFWPSFFAAHCVYLAPTHSTPHAFDERRPTHPPYAVRHKMLLRAMRHCEWHHSITAVADKEFNLAETRFLAEIMKDPYDPWADIFSDDQIGKAVTGIRAAFTQYKTRPYEPLPSNSLIALINSLRNRVPPIISPIDQQGTPQPKIIDMSQILYAGWVYWEGRESFPENSITFLQTNRLCDHALLHQEAISRVIKG